MDSITNTETQTISETQNINETLVNNGPYTEKILDETYYVEILYQANDGTYYINHKNFIDFTLLIIFLLFFVFTLISLTIKFFKLGIK